MRTREVLGGAVGAALLAGLLTTGGLVAVVAQSPSAAPSALPGATTGACPSPAASTAVTASPVYATLPAVTASPAPVVSPGLPAATAVQSSATPGACPTGGSIEAGIRDFEFAPVELTVGVGTTVRWTNSGPSIHTVTADGGSFDSGSLEPGATFEHTFETAGTFSYFCVPHPTMTGTVVVR